MKTMILNIFQKEGFSYNSLSTDAIMKIKHPKSNVLSRPEI